MQRIIPAILTADPAELREGLKILKGHANWVHVDIMDGKFVPNSSVNLFELGEASQIFNIEIHLMVESPEKYLEDCKSIGAKRVIFHLEAAENPAGVLQKMEEHGFQKEVGLNPSTPVSKLAPYVAQLDAVLVMSVNPGFQQQEFMPEVLSKISELRKLKQDITIGLDGGINEQTVTQAFEAGVDYACAGSAVMKSSDPMAALKHLEEIIS
ncbi:MAG: ribulose-phosphate 3-epimerase [Candidatus Wildermuthbacteria bacterium]|nr:ribulose-phosphate 3-epimerase [Candidatus Wildermuthbacteria bacterium]